MEPAAPIKSNRTKREILESLPSRSHFSAKCLDPYLSPSVKGDTAFSFHMVGMKKTIERIQRIGCCPI